MFANLSVMPALAKPYTVTIIVKDGTTNKPVSAGVGVYIEWRTLDVTYSNTYYTDSHGKINWFMGIRDTPEYIVIKIGGTVVVDNVQLLLNNKNGARVIVSTT